MLTRHSHSTSTTALVLPEDHPAIVEQRPLFKKSANEGKRHKARILVSGLNSRKIGRVVTKGAMKGFPIFTLTLTERSTCPRDCSMYSACYGNRSPWAIRWPAGEETEVKIEAELEELQARYPSGFLVRLHVLGDFYSVAYVKRWHDWLLRFPALHVFGFTARHNDDIAKYIAILATNMWGRFSIRSSDKKISNLPWSAVVDLGANLPGVVCPAQTNKTSCCGTCTLCWSAPSKTILFYPH